MTLESVTALMARLQEAVYQPVADLEISAWVTPEPVHFENRTNGRELHLKQGDCWGEKLFDSAWFRFTAIIPPGIASLLAVRIDINGELCLVDKTGVPVRGLTCVKSTFDLTLGAPAKTIYRLPSDALTGETIEIWGDAGFNDLFGTVVGEGRIEYAQLCVYRDDIRTLYYDVQVLGDLLPGLPANDPFRERTLEALTRVDAWLSDFNPDAVAAASELLRPFFSKTGPEPVLEISAIGHSHLDLAWLWPIRETIRKGARTFATALYNINSYPGYIFGCSQPQLFLWMKEHYPALYQKILEAVAEGRIEVLGTFWVEADCNLPCGESFVRQVLHGRRFIQDELGHVPRFCWLPDVFGYHGQLPQILKKSGHDVFLTQKLSWNLINRFPYHSFHWIGIDGTGILTHMFPEETYNSPAAPRSIRKIMGEYAQKDVSHHALMPYGIGDGGGGPDAEHLERIARCRHLSDLPRVVHRPVSIFLEEWQKDADRFPVWHGELYLERHQGTFTTQAKAKRNNRLCELGLREAEWASVLAEALSRVPYPRKELDALWREVLLYQFHDILPGSSIKRVYDESCSRYQIILDHLKEIIENQYTAAAASLLSNAPWVVFNSLPWAREEWVRHDGQWRLVRVPAMGFAELPPISTEFPDVAVTARHIENRWLRIEFAEDGTISSLYDKQCCRELLPVGERGNRFVVFEDRGDAWDFAADQKDIWVYLKKSPDAMALVESRGYHDGPLAVIEQIYQFRSSRLSLRISLTGNSNRIEFEATADWREEASMLRVQFPVDIEAPHAHFEIPFGSIVRSTHEQTSIEKAQIEVSAQQWVDLSDAEYGLALLNDCKYGFRVKGHVLDMNLIRSVPHPGSALINKGDATRAKGVYTDLGRHEFRYALIPHAGKHSEASLTEAARAFNIPLRVIRQPRSAGSASSPGPGSFVAFDNAAVDVPAVKQAEDGEGWVIRLVNVTPNPQIVKLRILLSYQMAVETDLTETPLAVPLHPDADGSLALEMAAFEVKTIHFR